MRGRGERDRNFRGETWNREHPERSGPPSNFDDDWKGERRYGREASGWSGESRQYESNYGRGQIRDYDQRFGEYGGNRGQGFGRGHPDDQWRPRWTEDRSYDERQRDRGYGAGISGEYWTRDRDFEYRNEPLGNASPRHDQADFGEHGYGRIGSGWGAGNQAMQSGGYSGAGYASSEREGASHYSSNVAQARREQARRDLRALELGGLQLGGFGSYAASSGESSSGFGYGRTSSERNTASFYGRGPKGFTRSDERIREDVSERLYEDHDVDATEITVSVRDGEVTLSGSVETRRMKHRAEDIADSVLGVKDVHNTLRVSKGVMQQLADKLHHGVEKLTGSEAHSEQGTRQTGTLPTSNHRSS